MALLSSADSIRVPRWSHWSRSLYSSADLIVAAAAERRYGLGIRAALVVDLAMMAFGFVI